MRNARLDELQAGISPKRKSTLNMHWKDDAETEAPILWPPGAKS